MRPDGAPGLLVAPAGTDPQRSLGFQIVDWAEHMLCHGPGDVEGEPLRVDLEMAGFLVLAYALNPEGRRLVNRAVLSRSKGRAKSEIAGFTGCVEALGPARFDHWARRGEVSWWGYHYTEGEPVGRPVRSPLLRCLATEEGQAGNTYDNVRVMLEKGKIAGEVAGIDVGLTRTFLPGSGEVRPCTAGSASKDGGKESWACADETHLYVLPELRSMHQTVSRNLVKRKIAEPWMLETSTMYQLGAGSVAEESHAYAQAIAAGQIRNRGLLFDHREGGEVDNWADDDAVLRALRNAYGEAAGWMDLERILDEIRNPATREVDARRYFLNQAVAENPDSWLPDGAFEACRKSGARIDRARPFVCGVDMALRHDTAAIVAAQANDDGTVTVEAQVWTPVDGQALDVELIEQHIRTLHRTGQLTACAYDPAWFERSAQALEADGVAMLEVPQSAARMVPAAGHAYELIATHRVVHDLDEVCTAQVLAAVPKASGEGWRLSKGKAKKKIDCAIALVIAVDEATRPAPEPESSGFVWILGGS